MSVLRTDRNAAWENGKWLLALLVLSFAGKVGLRLALNRNVDYWQTGYSLYYSMAENYLRTGSLFLGNPEAESGRYYCYRPPVYPLFIAGVCRIANSSATAFVVAEALVSTFTVGLVYSLSYWCLTLLAFYGLPGLRRSVYFKLFCGLALAQAAVSFVFWAHTSHRAFLDPLFAVPAGIGSSKLIARLSHGRDSRAAEESAH